MIFAMVNLVMVGLMILLHINHRRLVEESCANLERWEKLKDKRGYTELVRLSELCWVRALDRLDCLKKDPEVTGVVMVIGMQNGGGHAWIEYKRGKDVIQYDPTTEKVIQINEDIKSS